MRYNKNLKIKVEPIAKKYSIYVKGLPSDYKLYNDAWVLEQESILVDLLKPYVSARIAKHNKYNTDTKPDLDQEAYLAIINAIRRYDKDKGTFLTWLDFYIKKGANQYKHYGWIRVPSHVLEAYSKIMNSLEWNIENIDIKKHGESLGIKPVTVDKVIHFMKLRSIKTENHSAIEEDIDENSLIIKHDITESLNILSQEEKDLIYLRYYQEEPVGYISKILGISIKELNTKLNQALRKLKKELQHSDYNN